MNEITSYPQLVELIGQLGEPDEMEIHFDPDLPQSFRNQGEVRWGDDRRTLSPEILFAPEGEAMIELGQPDHIGMVPCLITLPNLGGGVVAEVIGFRVRSETQVVAALDYKDSWRLYAISKPEQLLPVVRPAHLNWAAAQCLPIDQQAELLATTQRWSLADHRHFFLSAMLQERGENGWVQRARQMANALSALLLAKDIRLGRYFWETGCWEGPSRDGMRGESSWTERRSAPALYWGQDKFHHVLLEGSPESTNLGGAFRYTVTSLREQLITLTEILLRAFTTEPTYENCVMPPYVAPESTVPESEREILSAEVVQLQAILDAVIAAAAHRLSPAWEEEHTQQEEAERQLLEPIFTATRLGEREITLATARQIRQFAEAVAEAVGGTRNGARCLAGILGPYSVLADRLRKRLPEFGKTEIGQAFFGLSFQADEQERWFRGAIAWLESLQLKPAEVEVQTEETGTTTLEDLAKAWNARLNR